MPDSVSGHKYLTKLLLCVLLLTRNEKTRRRHILSSETFQRRRYCEMKIANPIEQMKSQIQHHRGPNCSHWTTYKYPKCAREVLLEMVPDFFYPETCLKTDLDFLVFREDGASKTS